MNMNRKSVLTSACVLVMGGLLQTHTIAVEATFTGASVILTAPVCGEAYLRISGDSVETTRSFDSCSGMTFSVVDNDGQPLADGIYYYELTMVPQEMMQDEAALKKAMEENHAATFEEISTRLLNYAVARDGGMFRVSGGAASEYNEGIYEAEAQAETEAVQAEAQQTDDEANSN